MLVFRVVLLAVLAVVGVSIVLYLFTKEPRYLGFIRKVIRFAFVFLVIFALVYVAERLILI
jgi:hypothetical protein